MFVVKYDLQSMVKLIMCIEQHPVIYDTNNHEYSIRSEQDRAWKNIAKEVEESESLCRDRWRSIRACFGRHLRNKNINRKPYYLAEYLNFLVPFTSAAKASLKRLENGGGAGGSQFYNPGDDYSATFVPDNAEAEAEAESYDYDEIFDELYIDLQSEKPTIEFPVKRRRRSSSPMTDENSASGGVGDGKPTTTIKEDGSAKEDVARKKITSADPDIDFFKSILPEVGRMSPAQKLQFKQTVLSIIYEILYVKQDDTEQDCIDEYPIEQQFDGPIEPSVLLTVGTDSEDDQPTVNMTI